MPTRRALTLVDVLVGLAAAILLVALVVPAMASATQGAGVATSMSNLRVLGAAHLVYAADNDGRQLTYVVDDISTYGGNRAGAFASYNNQHPDAPHPGVKLGWGRLDGDGPFVWFEYRTDLFNSANAGLTLPICFFDPVQYFGSFRLWNARQFNQYLGGRFYDPLYYAPNDPIVHPIAEPHFDEPYQYVDTPPGAIGDIPVWSSYCTSPAALYDPSIMAAGEFINPWSTENGFTAPSLFAAKYPDLKTHMLEHHWLQDAPADPCNPAFVPGTYDGCEPYYFNQGLASSPATLFYDGHVRLLPNAEALAADETLLDQTGIGTWTRSTPFGADGYLSDLGYDTLVLNHHVLTVDGILGRDTLAEAGAASDAVRRRGVRPKRARDLDDVVSFRPQGRLDATP